MVMTLYNNKSDIREVRKNIATLVTLNNVYCKDDTDVVNPVILLDAVPSNCNYAKINEFNRYYVLTDVIHVDGLIETHWHVDVLMSFIPLLGKERCVVKRSATVYDMYLKDDETLLEAYTKTHVIPFPDGFDSDRQEFVLAVVGNTSSSANSDSGGNSGGNIL